MPSQQWANFSVASIMRIFRDLSAWRQVWLSGEDGLTLASVLSFRLTWER